MRSNKDGMTALLASILFGHAARDGPGGMGSERLGMLRGVKACARGHCRTSGSARARCVFIVHFQQLSWDAFRAPLPDAGREQVACSRRFRQLSPSRW